jgi:hypothetical protein
MRRNDQRSGAKFGVHRRILREAIGNPVLKPREDPGAGQTKLAAVAPFIGDTGSGLEGATEAAAHSASDLEPAQGGAPEIDVGESTVRRKVSSG